MIGMEKILIPATETDAEIFEKFRGNTWYKSDCRKARNPEFHKKGMALVRLIFNSQEQYRELEDLLVELKIKAGWYSEHVRSSHHISPLLKSMWSWAEMLPSPIAVKLKKYISQLRRQDSVIYLPKSISFADMDELEFQRFYNAVLDIAIQDYKLTEAVEFIGARKLHIAEEQPAHG
jgi:hypothetical protein